MGLITGLVSAREEVLKNKDNLIMVRFVDIHGRPVGRIWPARRIDDLAKSGPSFTGGSVAGAGQGPEHHEMVARCDFASYKTVSWLPNTVCFDASLVVDGQPHPYCPRGNLERVLGIARELGYVFKLGVEPEHYLVSSKPGEHKTPWNPDGLDGANMTGYNLNAVVPMASYLTRLMEEIDKMDWGFEQFDHEDGTRQAEVTWKYADALTTCDRLIHFRQMAMHHAMEVPGRYATFQGKPFPTLCGSGLHIHYHIADVESGQNLFLDKKDPRNLELSKLAYQFMGGIFHHASALCAIGNPTLNCYSRLHPDPIPLSGNHWVPARVAYSDDNRTVMVRVTAGHCEDRSPSGACNPYLLIAAYVAAGLDGITHNMDPGEPWVGSALNTPSQRKPIFLPKNLREALRALERDEVVKSALGPIADEFCKLKEKEVEYPDNQDAGVYFHYL